MNLKRNQDTVTIATFTPAHLVPVVELLAESLPCEGITTGDFARRVLLDPNFDPEGALVALSQSGDAVGFLMAITRRHVLEDGPTDRDRGWITLFAVSPEERGHGVGTGLLHAGENYLRARGCASALISPYALGYWTPGVDENLYPDTLLWLQRRGFVVTGRPLAMEINLPATWTIPDEAVATISRLRMEGAAIEPFAPEHALPLMDFLKEEFPGDWQRTARESAREILVGRRNPASVWVAMNGLSCSGFAQFEGERFGPIGVALKERGRGLGAALMVRTLEAMHSSGHSRAYFLWTSDVTADRYYRPAGFRDFRRFQVLNKSLCP